MNEALTGQWADSLLQVERLHILKLLAWASLSVLTGSALLAALRIRRITSPLLSHFAIQAIAWGALDLALALWAERGLSLRDLAGAVALDRFVWFNVGLDLGIIGVGTTLALFGRRSVAGFGLLGAGLGVVVQGLALVVLDLQLAAGIVR